MSEQPVSWVEVWRQRLRRLGRGVLTGLRKALPIAGGALAAFIALLAYRLVFPPPAPITPAQMATTVAVAMGSGIGGAGGTMIPGWTRRPGLVRAGGAMAVAVAAKIA